MYHTPDRRRYEARLLRVIAHIHDNLDGDLSLDRLADVACMSRFHWHRIFHAVTGETITATIRRIRLNRAAELMLQNAAPVSDVAARFGFSNRQSFVRAFTETFAVSPSRFRAARQAAPAFELKPIGRHDMLEVTIADRKATPLAALTHKGDYRELGRTFAQLFALLKTRNLTPTGAPLAIFYGDPDVVPDAELRAHAAIPLAAETLLETPMETAQLPAGRYAKATYRGPYADLKDAWDWFCDVWLAKSGEEPDGTPGFEVYISDPAKTAPDELITELYVRLKG